MGPVRPTRAEWLLALGCGLWVTGFLASERPALYLLPAIVVVAVLGLRRFPMPCALAVAAAELVGAILGVPSDNPASLAPALVSLYALGRYASGRKGTIMIAVFVLTAMVADEFTIPTALFASILFGGTWKFGRLVRRRTEGARLAHLEANRLAAQDLNLLTKHVVAEERSRLAGETVAVLRTAVEAMQAEAGRAQESLNTVRIAAIQKRGADAVGELRVLLGLLRTEARTSAPPPAPSPKSAWRADVLTAVCVAAIGVLDLIVMPGADQDPLGFALPLLLYATLAVRRTEPALACLAALVPMSLSGILDAPLTHGFAEVITASLLAWAVGTTIGAWNWTALTALIGVTLFVIWREDPDNVAITALLYALPAFAGHAWSEREREERAAQQRSTVLQEHRDAEIAQAVAQERLRIARDLHDVTSHAVGVMVLQASAALALADSAPADARAALRTVELAGADALSELASLSGVLDAGALGATGVASAGSRDLLSSLTALAERMRASGLRVELSLVDLPTAAQAGVATYRVVQEALTNAARHAAGSRVRVEIRRRGKAFEIKVYDDGRGPSNVEGSGFGLVGLAERVRALGGELATGPHPNGGFAVVARIPESPASAGTAP